MGRRCGGDGGSPKGDRRSRHIARGHQGVSLAGRQAGVLRTAVLARVEDGYPEPRAATPLSGSASQSKELPARTEHRTDSRGAGQRAADGGSRRRRACSCEAVVLGAGGGDGTLSGGTQRTAECKDGAKSSPLTSWRKGHMLWPSKIPVTETEGPKRCAPWSIVP